MIPPPPLIKLSGGKIKVVVSESVTNTAKGAFLYHEAIPKRKRSTNVTETLFLYFLDCRQVFKTQIQSFIQYKK